MYEKKKEKKKMHNIQKYILKNILNDKAEKKFLNCRKRVSFNCVIRLNKKIFSMFTCMY